MTLGMLDPSFSSQLLGHIDPFMCSIMLGFQSIANLTQENLPDLLVAIGLCIK